MECPKCKTRMRVQHTYKIDGASHTSRAACPACGHVVTCISMVVFEDPAAGQGAYSLSKKLGAKQVEALRKTAKTLF